MAFPNDGESYHETYGLDPFVSRRLAGTDWLRRNGVAYASDANSGYADRDACRDSLPPVPMQGTTLELTSQVYFMERVPPFVWGMARKAIEKRARERGLSEVTAQVVREVSKRFRIWRQIA